METNSSKHNENPLVLCGPVNTVNCTNVCIHMHKSEKNEAFYWYENTKPMLCEWNTIIHGTRKNTHCAKFNQKKKKRQTVISQKKKQMTAGEVDTMERNLETVLTNRWQMVIKLQSAQVFSTLYLMKT